MKWSGMEWNANDEGIALEMSPFESPLMANLPYQLAFHYFFNLSPQKLRTTCIKTYQSTHLFKH